MFNRNSKPDSAATTTTASMTLNVKCTTTATLADAGYYSNGNSAGQSPSYSSSLADYDPSESEAPEFGLGLSQQLQQLQQLQQQQQHQAAQPPLSPLSAGRLSVFANIMSK